MKDFQEEEPCSLEAGKPKNWFQALLKGVSGLLTRGKDAFGKRAGHQQTESNHGEVNQMSNYEGLFSEFKGLPGGIIQSYHTIQKEVGYLTEEAILAAAKVFDVPAKDAYEVASFYSYFSTKPRGKNIIRICESAPCHVAGANEVIAALEKALEIKVGDSTSDGKFALELTECVGQCQDTPVITVNGQPFGNITANSVADILAQF